MPFMMKLGLDRMVFIFLLDIFPETVEIPKYQAFTHVH